MGQGLRLRLGSGWDWDWRGRVVKMMGMFLVDEGDLEPGVRSWKSYLAKDIYQSG